MYVATYVSVGQLNLCYAELHSKQQEVIALRRYVLLLCLGGGVQREIESLLCLTVTSLNWSVEQCANYMCTLKVRCTLLLTLLKSHVPSVTG